MRYSTDWEDYELIDCSDGYKLERWTNEILVRPDPQVIWKSKKENKYWFQPDATYLRSRTGGGIWKVHTKIPSSWQVRYKDLTFNIKTMGFKHTGIFPEQAVNWDFTRKIIRESGRNDVKVLNLFAYTGGATVACLKEGASVVHVDASRGMVQWAKENAAASQVSNAQVRWIVDDCIKFVQREIRRGNKYDIIILDPPRKGCDASLFDTVCQMNPERIVYVSCDSSTLARDLKILDEKGYKTKRVCAVDMFPRTPHVEAVALIEKL